MYIFFFSDLKTDCTEGFTCPPKRPGDDPRCIAQSWVCDGEYDCPGGEDEEQSCRKLHSGYETVTL